MGDSSGSSGTLGESQAVEITGKIMVVAIIFLFFVVVFVIFLHIYAKCFWGRIGESTAPQRGSRRRRRFVFAPGQDPAMYGAHRIGLDPAVLRSLPVVVYQPEDFKDGLECAVCLSELVQGEKARLLPKCNHGFHVDCIDMWFQSHSTCPLCRNPVASESCKPSSSSNAQENVSENSLLSEADNSGAMSDLESPNFPTNVLIGGDHTQVSSIGDSLEEGTSQPPCSSSSTSSSSTTNSNNSRRHGMLVIDIPSEFTSSSLSASASRFAEEDLKSPMTARLRSLKRLLSWDKRLSPYSPSSIDVEQAGRGQS